MTKQEVLGILGDPKTIEKLSSDMERWTYLSLPFGFGDGTGDSFGKRWEAYVLVFIGNSLSAWKKQEGQVKS